MPTSNNNSFFITSTGTEIGKTLASILCVQSLCQKSDNVGYFKPIASGCEEGNWGYRSPDEELIIEHTSLSPDNIHSTSRFDAPLSPDKAAAKEHESIEVGRLIEEYEEYSSQYDYLVVEGIGGVAVPFDPTTDVSDLINEYETPVSLVVSSKLGTISYTRTAVSYLEKKNCRIKSILLTPGDGEEIVDLNRNHLKEFYPRTHIDILPEIDSMSNPDSKVDRVINDLLRETLDTNLPT